jgi:hypothetical protein
MLALLGRSLFPGALAFLSAAPGGRERGRSIGAAEEAERGGPVIPVMGRAGPGLE